MGEIQKTLPVKLIFGFIFKDEDYFIKATKIISARFGPIEFISPAINFIHTDYYQNEFGLGLKRKFISLKDLIDPVKLPQIKLFSNKIEKKFSRNNQRLINIDPGYMELAKLVLASTKNFAHRIYLNHGIFAEITLTFKDGSFQELSWTYPDYRTKEYIEMFNNIRNTYAQQIKNL